MTKYALVTGCSSGIGKEVAKEAHKRGYVVFAGARRVEMMADLEQLGIHVISLDVSDQGSVDKALAFVQEHTDKLDILVNNAGQSCTFPASDVTIENAQKCFDVNLFGVMRMVQTFLPLLINAKGVITQIGSVAGIIQFPYSSVYNASKAALHQYSNSLRVELKPFGVRVVTVATAAVLTSIADTRPLPQGSLYTDVKEGFAERQSMAKNNTPMAADLYARKVLNKVEQSNPPSFFWEGNNSWMLWFASRFLPQWLFDFMLMRKFGLDKLNKLKQS